MGGDEASGGEAEADEAPLDIGRRGAKGRRNPRTCIVTRTQDPPEGLVRFVLDPEDRVVPDIANRLPGRGAHVTARQSLVERAARRHVFNRAFRREVSAPDDLADETARLMRALLLRQLPMLRKAGDLVVGARNVDAIVRAGEALVILHAAEAAPDGVRKIDQARHAAYRDLGVDTAVETGFTTDELGVAFGGDGVIHAAVRNGDGGRAFEARRRRYRDFVASSETDEPADP